MARAYTSYAGYGVDVGEHRADDLDRLLLEYLNEKVPCRVLDIGCGAGGTAIKIAKRGGQVTAIDIHDFNQLFAEVVKQHPELGDSLVFKQVNALSFLQSVHGDTYEAVLFQRALHYVPYLEAVELLRLVRIRTHGKLFISVTGLESAVATDYPGTAVALPDRICPLAPEQAERFLVRHPVCLYTQAEFVALLQEAGWQVAQVWTSAFGNHKAVCLV